MNSILNFKFIIVVILGIMTLTPLTYINLQNMGYDITYKMIFFNLLNSLNVVGIIILIIYNIVKYIDSYYDQYHCSDGVNRTFKEIKLDFCNNKKNYNFIPKHILYESK